MKQKSVLIVVIFNLIFILISAPLVQALTFDEIYYYQTEKGKVLGQTAPGYVLASSPFSAEQLGSPLQSNTQEHQIMFVDSSGDKHLLLYYDVTQIWKYPIQILDINLSTGAYHLVDSIFGRPGPNGTLYYPANNKVYIGSGDPGYFMEYDPATGGVRQIAKLSQKGLQYSAIGDDGGIYLGEMVWAGLERYNPDSGAVENFGDLDPANHNSYYSYTVGADSEYAYVGIGQAPWYLAIVNLQTKEVVLQWKDQNDTGGTVHKAVSGGWYYERINNSQPWYRKWYKLENGAATEIPASSVPALNPWYKRGNVVKDPANIAAAFGIELNLDNSNPDSGNGNTAVIKWRNVGAPDWRSATVSGFRIEPVNIKRLYSWDGAKMFGFADFYGPVFSYDTVSNALQTLGRTGYSNYDALFDGPNDIYISGYTAATLRYDPAKPWTLTASTPNNQSTAVNPYKTPLAIHKYQYYSAKGSDGFVYVGTHHERDSTGGELSWYNPANNTNAGTLRNPFLNYDVRDLKPVLNGTKLVYASNNEKLFVFDVASKSIEREIIPLPGIGGLDKVAEVAPGIIVSAAGAKFYKANVATGEILYVKDLPAVAYSGIPIYDHRITVGPDGFVWIYLGTSLYRIDPSDGSAQKILTDTGAYTAVFKGADLYLYGGPDLRRIKNIIIPTSAFSPAPAPSPTPQSSPPPAPTPTPPLTQTPLPTPTPFATPTPTPISTPISTPVPAQTTSTTSLATNLPNAQSVVVPAGSQTGDIIKFQTNPTVFLVSPQGLHPFDTYGSFQSYVASYQKHLRIYPNSTIGQYTVVSTPASQIIASLNIAPLAAAPSVVLPANVKTGDLLKFRGAATVYLVTPEGLYPFDTYGSFLDYAKSSRKRVKVYPRTTVKPFTVLKQPAIQIISTLP